MNQPLDKTIAKLKLCSLQLCEFLWRIAELHLYRLILILCILMATYHYCVMSFALVLVATLTPCFPYFKRIFLALICILTITIFVSQFLGSVVKNMGVGIDNCSILNTSEIEPSPRVSETFGEWIGFGWSHEVGKNIKEDGKKLVKIIAEPVILQVIIVLLIVIDVLIFFRQKMHRKKHAIETPPDGIIFTDSLDATIFDRSVFTALKVACNYFFYKFGVELSLIWMVFVAWIRMDVFGVIVLSLVMFMCMLNRRMIKIAWIFVVIYVLIEVPLQYAMELGLPYRLCKNYPWSSALYPKDNNATETAKMTNLLEFLDLPNYRSERRIGDFRLISDYILLILVVSQWLVFRVESKKHQAKDNNSIYSDGKYVLRKDNPHYDFIAEQKNFVDYIKIFVFMYGHWITLLFFLIAGLGGISLFALGYLLLGFWMLWEGNNLYTIKRLKATLTKWQIVCGYNVLSMLWKVSLQIIGCSFINVNTQKGETICKLRQIFSVVCVNPESFDRLNENQLKDDSKDFCFVEQRETRIGLDLIAFIFIIFQLRILNSYFFQHCIMEIRCETVLATRGAILINQLVEKQMIEQNNQERKRLNQIRQRVAMINKVCNEQNEQSGTRYFIPETYAQAKLSGDYYMFDYDPNKDDSGENKDLDPEEIVNQSNEPVEEEIEAEVPEILPKEEDEKSSPLSKSNVEKAFNALQFVWKLLVSGLNFLSTRFNTYSREQRYVAYVLDREKVRLKSNMKENLYAPNQSSAELRTEWNAAGLHLVSSVKDIARLEEEVQGKWQQHSVFSKFLISIGNFFLSYTHVLSYILACVTHGVRGGLITLPLPLMVFFWATLSSPRPPKIFWVILITYTELIILIKFVFQFDFINIDIVSKDSESPANLANIFGVQHSKTYGLLEVLLLISLFLHRYILRKFGLWKNANVDTTFEEPINSNSRRTSGASITPMPERSIQFDTQSIMTTNQTESEWEKQRRGFSLFYYNLKNRKICYVRDLYPLMFCLDVACLLVITLGYQHFGEASSTASILQSSRIPLTFLALVLIFISMMIIDRALYLCKAVRIKLYYQLFIVVLLHVWIMVILPVYTQTRPTANAYVPTFYVLKCLYLLVSAWQIRNGYPRLCIGNMLTRSYGLLNYILFLIYYNLPLIFEIRTIVDWTWTKTTMPLFDFIKMEVFYARVFMVKCSRELDKTFPSPSGIPKPALVKYFIGVPFTILVVLVALSPLLLFAILKYIGDETTGVRLEMYISLEGYPPLYRMNAEGPDLMPATDTNIEHLYGNFSNANGTQAKKRTAATFIGDYRQSDIWYAKFRPESQEFWQISAVSLDALKLDLKNNSNADLKNKHNYNHTFQLDLKLIRSYGANSKANLIIQTFSLKKDKLPDALFKDVLKMIKEPNNNKQVEIPLFIPNFLVVPNDDQIVFAESLYLAMFPRENRYDELGHKAYSNVSLRYRVNENDESLWTIQCIPYLNSHVNVSKFLPEPERVNYGPDRNLTYIPIYLFVDRKIPQWLSTLLSGASIIACYVSFVFVFARVFRTVIVSSPLEVIVEEMPNPDHVLKIFLDIYLIREEARNFLLEQDLFARLLFLFRSPETLIKWTRQKYD